MNTKSTLHPSKYIDYFLPLEEQEEGYKLTIFNKLGSSVSTLD